jgi:glycosyltransferase involved in cell wall biosynthesis
MNNLGVKISLYNAEYTIKACLEPLIKTFSNIEVIDFGSTDKGIEIVKSLGVPIRELEKLSPVDYTIIKDNISKETPYVFWLDADEIYEKEVLYKIPEFFQYDKVEGYWRNIDIKDNILASEPTCRGSIFWNTKKFSLVRAWPRERLNFLGDIDYLSLRSLEDFWCWHAILLPLSSSPISRERENKQNLRREQFRNLEWTVLKDLPFSYPSFIINSPNKIN